MHASFRAVLSNPAGILQAAVEAAAAVLNSAVKPVMLGGPKMWAYQACEAFEMLADKSGYAVAVMPNAKVGFSIPSLPRPSACPASEPPLPLSLPPGHVPGEPPPFHGHLLGRRVQPLLLRDR